MIPSHIIQISCYLHLSKTDEQKADASLHWTKIPLKRCWFNVQVVKRVRSKPADIKQTPDNNRGTRHQTSEWREPMWHKGLKEQRRTDLKSSFLNGDLTVNSSAVIRTHRLQLVFIQREELSSGQNTQTVDGPDEIKHTVVVNHCSHDDHGVMFTAGRRGLDSHSAEALELKPGRHLLRRRVIRDVYRQTTGGASGSL